MEMHKGVFPEASGSRVLSEDLHSLSESTLIRENTGSLQGSVILVTGGTGLVGSLLISALVIFPALSAMRIFKNFKSVTIFAAVLSVLCAALGIVISILAGTPVGSTIVATDTAAFLICMIVGAIGGGSK